MRDKLKMLEQAASSLEPNQALREELRNRIVSYTDQFIEGLPNLSKSPTYQIHTKGKELLDYPIKEEPLGVDKTLALIEQCVDHEGLNPASGGHLGYIPGGGIYTSSLGDYWADITNRYAGVFFANPGAVRMENHLLDWMRQMIGFPKTALGNMASGGSIANLIAVVTARDAFEIQPKEVHKHVIYLSKQVHHCIDKAIHIAGLRQAQIRYIDLDKNYRMDTEHLKTTIQEDIKAGLHPFMIVASAGTTDTGAVDPLETLAGLAKKYKIWLHVDAAYGGFFMLTDEGKNKLAGIELSDSVVIDPHKGLFIPYGLGVVLIRDGHLLKKAFAYQANYLQDTIQLQDDVSPSEVSPELTKHFRALRLWLPLMVHGLKPFRACLEEKLLLAKYAYKQLQKIEGIEVGPEPELSVVTFRYRPEQGDANEFNAKLVKAIQTDGRIFVSSTTIDGVFTIRLAILSFRTHLAIIDQALAIIGEKIEQLIAKV